jgi:tetratricopeptide (TPR) repeat protein
MKNIFVTLSILSLLMFVSCGGDNKSTTTNSSDASSVNTPEELKQLNAQLLADPNNAELYHKRAKYYLDTKNLTAGVDDMTKAIHIDSTKAEYFLTLSDLYFIINKTGDAKKALEKAIQLDNKNIDAILKLAELYLYVSKSEKSMEYINMALRLDQYNAKAYFMKGMNYKDMKDTAKAISSMQTAVEQDQQYYHAYMQLGILCAAQKNPLAIQYYKNAMRIKPTSIETWYDLGKFYQDVEDWKNALATYTTLLKIDAGNKYAHYNIAVIHLINLKKFDIAIDHFTDALKLDPKYVEAYYGRGCSYEALGDTKTALNDFQACLAINPQYEPAQAKIKQMNKGKKSK